MLYVATMQGKFDVLIMSIVDQLKNSTFVILGLDPSIS